MTLRRLAACVMVLALLPAGARAQSKGWPSEMAPRALKAKRVAFPAYEMRTLANGLQVVVVPHHEQPAVSVRLLVGAGSAQDPPDRLGLANLVASLLDQGTTARSARQLADDVDGMGGQLQIGAATDLTFGFVTVLADRFDRGLDVLAEVVRTPAFAQEEIERQRAQIRSALAVAAQDPETVATTVFRRLVYGEHPYGSTGTGTPASLDRITRADLTAFHQRYYLPNNSMLAIVGDIDAATAFAGAERAFGGWASRAAPLVMNLPPPAASRRLVVIDKPDAVQTEIRVGQLGIRRDAADFLDFDLAVRILGGEGANRLQQVLRVQRGLTYGAAADLDAMRQLGHVMASTDTRTDATAETLRVMLDEFTRLARDPIGERELEDAKAFVAGSFPLTIETPDAIAARILTALFFNLPLKDLGALPDRVDALTLVDVQHAAQFHLRTDRLTIVLVGNAAGFLPQIAKLGIRPTAVIPIGQLDVSSSSLRVRPAIALGTRPTSKPATRPGPAEWAVAKPIVMQAVAAAGGLDALKQIRTLQATSETTMPTPGGPLKAATTTYVEYPGKMRVDAALPPPQGATTQTIVGDEAWFRDVNGVRDAPEGIRREMIASLSRDWIALLRAAADDRLTGRRLPDETGVADRVLRVVELWTESTAAVRLTIDAEHGRIVSVAYDARGPAETERMTESFSDFRPVGGLVVPFRSVLRRGDMLLFERAVVDFQVNPPLAPALFVKPTQG